jgi:hypothetical protein
MSYDLYVRPAKREPCVTCHRPFDGVIGHEDINVTYNVSRIVDLCLVAGGATKGVDLDGQWNGNDLDFSWKRLHGVTTDVAVPILRKAQVEATREDRQIEFRKLEPPNGWGSLENVIEVFVKLTRWAEKNPGGFIEVH